MRRGLALTLTVIAVAGCSSDGGSRTPTTTAPSTSASASTPTAPAVTTPTRATTPTATPTTKPIAKPTRTRTTPPKPRTSTTTKATALPLDLTTGSARQVITVVASSESSTTATLQAWARVNGGWQRVGPAVDAHLGSGGLGRASESSSRTPAGSFTLTQAFGHDADPGTALPYTRTTPDDWWISEAGPLYNTRQRCASSCDFTRGDPNEHLYFETPYYDYAVVIDYNTRNAPGGVRAGAGSAFFLHVSVGEPTAGCVSIPKTDLVRILRWLDPAAHPRMLLGTTG